MNQQKASAFLQGISPALEGQRFTLERDEVLIGRGTKCQIQIQDPKISRQHARIRFEEGRAIIEDLESSHGTLVNGQRVISAELTPGDELTLGDTRLRFDLLPDEVATVMADEPEPHAAEARAPSQTMACRHCGEQVEADKRFCPHCGKPLHGPTPGDAPALHPIPVVTPPVALPQESVLREGRERRRWLPFMLGVSIPVFLAGMLVAVLILLGVFDEPEALPDVQIESRGEAIAEDAELPEPAGAESPGSSATLPFGFRAYNPDTDRDLPRQADLAEYDQSAGEDQQSSFVIDLQEGQDLVLEIFYCGKTESLLADVATVSNVTMEIEHDLLTEERMYKEVMKTDTRACNVYLGVLYDIVPGEYLIVQTISVDEQVYDGWESWGPEELLIAGLIRMNDEVVNSTGEGSAAGETPRPEDWIITLHDGDARMFSTPPSVIAYANTQQRQAPAELAIEEGCADDCIRYYEWMGIPKADQWIEGVSTVPTTAIGVQLWGDTTGGFARVYLDGEEVWSGDTRGEDNQWPGGAFVRYLEISGLPNTSHGLIVQALGDDGPVTLYFFGIGPVIP